MPREGVPMKCSDLPTIFCTCRAAPGDRHHDDCLVWLPEVRKERDALRERAEAAERKLAQQPEIHVHNQLEYLRGRAVRAEAERDEAQAVTEHWRKLWTGSANETQRLLWKRVEDAEADVKRLREALQKLARMPSWDDQQTIIREALAATEPKED